MVSIVVKKAYRGDHSKPRERLGKEIVLLLVLKVVMLGVLFAFFFSPSQRPDISHSVIERHLLDQPSGRR